jgi:hypothetical protein
VFINCPFDAQYEALFQALVFAVFDCGLVPRSAREVDDSSAVRISKIEELIGRCQFGIHDISRTELDARWKLPRLNMALELGLFLGAKRFGDQRQRSKVCLILDRTAYRYQRFCSDIAGQDVAAHRGAPSRAIVRVRDWLAPSLAHRGIQIPSGSVIGKRYRRFRRDLPALCARLALDQRSLIFTDWQQLMFVWLRTVGTQR